MLTSKDMDAFGAPASSIPSNSQAGPSMPLPMKNPSAGSANPAASFPALWNYIEPALDHIVRSPTNDNLKAPAIDVAYHMGIHTAVYNYFTSSRFEMDTLSAGASGSSSGEATPPSTPHGADLYEKLDKYYSDICHELLANTPVDDSTLIYYLVPCFNRYSAGANSVNRLLNYVNRQYVKRAVEEDRGWLRFSDILKVMAQTVKENDPREGISKKLKERRMVELKKWGLKDGGGSEEISQAEAAAEAASSLDRVIPLQSMAHRRFREEVIKPLLALPRGKGKKKPKKSPGTTSTDVTENNGPKSRLARAVKVLTESTELESESERKALAQDLNNLLGMVGIPNDHALRKRLEKYCLESQA